MKNYLKPLVTMCLIASLFALIPSVCFAQLGDPGPDPDAPIDGGVGILLAAGIGYGIKKYRESGKPKADL